MPNLSKPTNIKALSGTIQKCRDAAKIEAFENLKTLDELPPCPDWMPNGHAVKEWDNVGRTLMANKMLCNADLPVLAQMCALHGKVVQLYSAGEYPHASLITALLGFYRDLGMTPVSRSKVKILNPDKPAGNKFAKNGTRS